VVKGATAIGTVDQTLCRLFADDLPVRRSSNTSKETFCPSLRLCIPARSTALMCTDTSRPSDLGSMACRYGMHRWLIMVHRSGVDASRLEFYRLRVLQHKSLISRLKLHRPPMPESLLASVDETGQRCLIVCAGAAAAGAVACLDTAPAPFATLVGVCGRRAVHNALTASVTAVLISA
jgi:hypothetical protein